MSTPSELTVVFQPVWVVLKGAKRGWCSQEIWKIGSWTRPNFCCFCCRVLGDSACGRSMVEGEHTVRDRYRPYRWWTNLLGYVRLSHQKQSRKKSPLVSGCFFLIVGAYSVIVGLWNGRAEFLGVGIMAVGYGIRELKHGNYMNW